MYTVAFWKAAGERLFRTFLQSLVGFITIQGIGFQDIDWALAASVSGVAALASAIMSMIAGLSGESSTPSFTRAETLNTTANAEFPVGGDRL